MLLQDIMTPNVECIGPDETVEAAAQRMRDLDVGILPVCENDRLAGMITDRDIAIRAVADGCDPTTCRVRDVMTPDVIYCFEDDAVEDAEHLMERRQVRRLLVLNRKKRLVGILALGDIAVRTADDRQAGAVLHAVSEPMSV